MLKLLQVLWPSFLMAAFADVSFFAIFEPSDLTIFGYLLPVNSLALYTMGFLAFWSLCALSSAMTCMLIRDVPESPFNHRV